MSDHKAWPDWDEFVRRLREDAAFREEVRRQVLTEDLLKLPATVEVGLARASHALADLTEWTERAERQIAEFAKQARQNADVAGMLVRAVEGLLEAFRGADRFFARMWLEERWVRKAPGYLYPRLRRARVIGPSDLGEMLWDAVDRGVLTEEELGEVLSASLVAEGEGHEGTPLRALVELALTVGPEDIWRARDRAGLLARLGTPVIAVAAGPELRDEGVRAKAQRADVWLIEDLEFREKLARTKEGR